jgi:TolB-like protein/Tfp pilus assembly protein PilF
MGRIREHSRLGSALAISLCAAACARAPAPVDAGARPAVVATISAPAASAQAPRPAIAVIAEGGDWLGNGLAEELGLALRRVPGLRVAGQQPSVQYLLAITARRHGEKLRMDARLQAADGAELWTKRFDIPASAVADTEEGIARAVAERLRLEVAPNARLAPPPATSAEAWQLYLRASDTFARRDGAHMLQALAQLKRATALDPGFARAWSRLAALYVVLPTYVGLRPADARVEMQQAARRALALDPDFAEPWAVLGMASDPDFGESRLIEQREAFEKALAIDADDLNSNFWYGLSLLRTGYNRAGLERIERALEIDPAVPNVQRWRGIVYLRNGEDAAAEPYLRRAYAAGLKLAARELAEIEARRGNFTAARRLWVEGFQPLLASLPPEAATVIPDGLYGEFGARQRAVALLQKHVADSEQVSGLVPFLLTQLAKGGAAMEIDSRRLQGDNADFLVFLFSPAGVGTRALPEYRPYLRAQGFPELWARYGPPDTR